MTSHYSHGSTLDTLVFQAPSQTTARQGTRANTEFDSPRFDASSADKPTAVKDTSHGLLIQSLLLTQVTHREVHSLHDNEAVEFKVDDDVQNITAVQHNDELSELKTSGSASCHTIKGGQ